MGRGQRIAPPTINEKLPVKGQLMGQNKGFKAIVFAAAALGLAGCMGDEDGGRTGGGIVSRFASSDPATAAAKEAEARTKEAAESRIITTLQARRSVLPTDSTFDTLSVAVLAANARTAEAQLRSARLRAKAMSTNWFPTIGPNISLTSLGAVVASLVIEQVLFDNGRKKAERDFAKADVEVAAVILSMDTNERLHVALGLYLAGQEAREKAYLGGKALKDMKHFEWIMVERVNGGVSDMSDLNVIRHKLAEMQSAVARETEAANAAIAELNAMSVTPLDDLNGLSEVRISVEDAQPLAVLLAEAEMERSIAKAKIDRAGLLPGLTAKGTVGSNGSGGGISVSSGTVVGLGTRANLRAIEAAKDAANRRVAQAREDANRVLRSEEQHLAGLARQVGEASGLTGQAKANLDLFQAQYEAGQRQVMDVVGVFETFARQQQSQVGLKYDMARARVKIANELGLLADGGEI